MIFKPSTLLSRGSKSLQRQSNDNLKKKILHFVQDILVVGFYLESRWESSKIGL